MNKKLKSTLSLVALLAVILLLGGAYIFFFQSGKLSDREAKLKELNSKQYDTQELTNRYNDLLKRSAALDSILAARKFNIPQNVSSIKFYNFINNIISGFSNLTKVDVEFLEQKQDKEFFIHEYKVSGHGDFNEVYRLINSIEESKELKKVNSVAMTNLIYTDNEEIPHFLVNYNMVVDVYYSNDDRFATSEVKENDLAARTLYDAFYPLIRNEIPPNLEGLLDVQGAKLLAIIPEGAFIADSKGNTYLVWEGEEVYLGYLTKIDYDNNRVSFILNKGGIIERVDLDLEKEQKQVKQ